jgi:predicted pyridoxine 5'-phosphate oxidase superfamily flavin-nucleotide-binding protein
MATADDKGAPDCSFKGGPPGFVRVAAPDLLVFPDYDGNGMFKSLGNILANPQVGLLFIAMGEAPKRLRVNGTAEVVRDDPAMAAIPGAQLLVKVTPVDIFPNCPRYIPRIEVLTPSDYLPAADGAPIEPKWKSFGAFSDVVPPRRR